MTGVSTVGMPSWGNSDQEETEHQKGDRDHERESGHQHYEGENHNHLDDGHNHDLTHHERDEHVH
ncbi:MAG: hypothetical protein IT221_12405 [Fluviicola sp.]|nr:hypothetical protein [Fluviicola sp.]